MYRTSSLALRFTLALFFGLLSFGVSGRFHHLVFAQTPEPTPVPGDTLATMQVSINTLSTQVANFETQVALNKQAIEVQTKIDILPFLAIAVGVSFISVIAGLFGLTTPIAFTMRLRRDIEKKVTDRLNNAIYRVDPTYLPIYIPKYNFELEHQRLERLGFRALRPYTSMAEIQPVCLVVYHANSLDHIIELGKFITDREFKNDQIAFIIYTSGHIEGGNQIYKVFENVTFANNATTVATHIYSLARVLI